MQYLLSFNLVAVKLLFSFFCLRKCVWKSKTPLFQMSIPADYTETRDSAQHGHNRASIRTGKGTNGGDGWWSDASNLQAQTPCPAGCNPHSTCLPREAFRILERLPWIPPLPGEDNLITVPTKKAASPEMCIQSVRLYLKARKFNKGAWGGDRAGPTWLTGISFLTNSQLDFGLTLNVYRINALGFGEWWIKHKIRKYPSTSSRIEKELKRLPH